MDVLETKWFVPRSPKSDDSHCHHFFNSDDHFLQFIQIWRRCFKILIFYLILFFQPVQKGVEIAQTEYSQHSSILAN